MLKIDKYEPVIGLEVHVQLLTESKLFSFDRNEFGEQPNTHVSAISLGHPGTLPKINKKAIEYAVKLGIACNCQITELNGFARKHYFYPDLPKGYQITQYETPICVGGYIAIKNGSKKIQLHQIHIEEDAGKNIHDRHPEYSLVDLNRAGVPLLEMVSEPAIHAAEDAYEYLIEIRKLVRYLDICDGNMEEGSMRCDANVSIRLKGEKTLGNKVEVKNLNSIRNVRRAIEHEIQRQTETLESGGKIRQSTRSFDAVSGTTFELRGKEMAHDYRYFSEPDLPPTIISKEYIEKVKLQMPVLPNELVGKYTSEFGLSEYDASVLTDSKEMAFYYEEIIRHTKNYKAAANWLMGTIKSYLNEHKIEMQDFPVRPQKIAQLIILVDNGKVSHSITSQKIFPLLVKGPEKSPLKIAEQNNWLQQSDEGALHEIVKQAIGKYPEKAEAYRKGKKGLAGLFMGEVMKLSKGRADPKIASQLVKQMLEEN